MSRVPKSRFPKPHYTVEQATSQLLSYCEQKNDYFLITDENILQVCQTMEDKFARAILAANAQYVEAQQ
jgi:hypothetical protein